MMFKPVLNGSEIAFKYIDLHIMSFQKLNIGDKVTGDKVTGEKVTGDKMTRGQSDRGQSDPGTN
jgi:hypothetical protein